MPNYDFECESCGHRFEAFQSFSESPLKTCPSCNKDTLRRLFGTGAAILFKGSGFYETDYRSDSYKNAAKQEQDSQKSPQKSSTDGSSTGTTASNSSPSKVSSDSAGSSSSSSSSSTSSPNKT